MSRVTALSMRRFKRLPFFNRRSFMSLEQATPGPMEKSMRAKLTAQLQPTELKIRNDSWQHRNHAAMMAESGGNGETHFFVHVVSNLFSGKTTMQRHRMIYSALSEELSQGLHALSMTTRTPEEAQAVETS